MELTMSWTIMTRASVEFFVQYCHAGPTTLILQVAQRDHHWPECGHDPPPPWRVKNRPKKDGGHTRWLIFHVSWPPSPKFLDVLLNTHIPYITPRSKSPVFMAIRSLLLLHKGPGYLNVGGTCFEENISRKQNKISQLCRILNACA